MKKYLLTIWSQNPEYYFIIDNKIRHLLKKKSKVFFICQNNISNQKNNYKSGNYSEKKIWYSKVNIINKFYFFYYILYLTFLTIIKRPDCIIVYNNYPILFIKLVSIFFKTKFIYHNFDYNDKPRSLFLNLINFIEKKSLKLFNLIVFSNEKRTNFFLNKYRKDNLNIITIHNVLSIKYKKYFKGLKKVKSKKNVKIFRIGSIGPGHGLFTLVKSLKFLPSNYQLTLCGKIMDYNFFNSLKKIINKEKISEKIKIYNSPKRKKWEKLLVNSDLGVALYERINFSHKFMVGASQKINSYLAAGLPVLAYNDHQFSDFNKKYKCCLLINGNNSKTMAKSIKNVFKRKNKIKSLRKHSSLAFKKYYNFENEFIKFKKYL